MLYARRFGIDAGFTPVLGTKTGQRSPNSPRLLKPPRGGFRMRTSPWSHDYLRLACSFSLAKPHIYKAKHGQRVSTFSSLKKGLAAEVAKVPNNPPRYLPPQSGLLSHLPSSWVPYAELMRLEKPAGLYLFYFPYLFGTLYGACLTLPIVSPSYVIAPNIVLLAGTMIMRGAACSWNDNIDRAFDRQVARCCLRPIARGAITPGEAHLFTGIQSLVGLGMLALLPMNCTYYAMPIIVLLGLYPFAKRVFNYPQVVLGFPVSWAIFMGMSAINIDPHILLSESNPSIVAGMVCLYASNIAWTVIYDTIYAHQDIRDDSAAGVRSIAVYWGERSKDLLSGLAVAQVTMLVAAGAFTGLGPVYYTASCGVTAISLAVMIYRVDLTKPSDCMWWFKNGAWFVGGSITAGLLGEYMHRLLNSEAWEEGSENDREPNFGTNLTDGGRKNGVVKNSLSSGA